MRCSRCDAEKSTAATKAGNERLPKGWKRAGDAIWCSGCWKKAFRLSAITVPIAGPVCLGDDPKNGEPLDWKGFRERLRRAWDAARDASNWMLRQLAIADPWKGDDGKLLPFPWKDKKLYFYPQIGEKWPEMLGTGSINTLEQHVKAKYSALRLRMARYECSLPSIRNVPIPVHRARWKIREEPGGWVLLSFHMPDRITVRIRGGWKHKRTLAGIRKIIAGEVEQAELAILPAFRNFGINRPGFTKSADVQAKLVAWFPREAERDGSAVGIHTGGDAFLTMYDAGQNRIFRWNADHVRRRILAHDDELQRLREDLKAERRLGRERDGILARMEMVSRNHGRYMHDFCHTTSREVVNLALRRRAGAMVYVDDAKDYMPHFPWAKFATMLCDKAERAGIVFGASSGEAESESEEPLEVEV